MVKASEITVFLRRAPLFCDVSAQTLEAINREAQVVSYDSGERLFTSGDPPDYLHVLIEGPVKLVAEQFDGRESIIELLQPVDSFIMAAVLTAKPYLMTAVAVGPVRVLLIPGELLRELVGSDPRLALVMLASMGNQYRQLVRHIKDLRLRTAAQRLGVYLLQLADKEQGGETLRLPFVKKLIAARLNVTPESLSRAIGELREAGVEMREDEVQLHDIEELRRFCHVDHILDQLDEDLFVLSER